MFGGNDSASQATKEIQDKHIILVSENKLAIKYLAPALITLYGDVEHTGCE